MKNKKETYGGEIAPPPQTNVKKDDEEESEEGEEGEEVVTTKGTEEFTCGGKSGIPAYDDQEDVYAAF